jgi:alkylated DNA repair dioxygenase AlkB
MRITIAPGFFVYYVQRFYEPTEAYDVLRALQQVEMSPECTRIFGRVIVTKRRSEQYGHDYRYNPEAKEGKPWTPLMSAIRARMQKVAGMLDGGLVQVYPSGQVGLGWHEDAGKPDVIASLSLGAERDFVFGVSRAGRCREVWRMRLGHGSLLVIPGATNAAFKHRVPPATRIIEPRVNVTMRRFPTRPDKPSVKRCRL